MGASVEQIEGSCDEVAFNVSWWEFYSFFSKVNFASQKRSFTCLALLDVQDDR